MDWKKIMGWTAVFLAICLVWLIPASIFNLWPLHKGAEKTSIQDSLKKTGSTLNHQIKTVNDSLTDAQNERDAAKNELLNAKALIKDLQRNVRESSVRSDSLQNIVTKGCPAPAVPAMDTAKFVTRNAFDSLRKEVLSIKKAKRTRVVRSCCNVPVRPSYNYSYDPYAQLPCRRKVYNNN
jgi:hypothetical protein